MEETGRENPLKQDIGYRERSTGSRIKANVRRKAIDNDSLALGLDAQSLLNAADAWMYLISLHYSSPIIVFHNLIKRFVFGLSYAPCHSASTQLAIPRPAGSAGAWDCAATADCQMTASLPTSRSW